MLGLLMGAGAAVAREWPPMCFGLPRWSSKSPVDIVSSCRSLRRSESQRLGSAAAKRLPIEEFVLDAPYSRFTETLRNVKALIDTARS